MYQDNVMVPIGDWAKTRLKNLSETDKRRDPSRVGSGFGKNVSKWVGKEKVYPTNVLHLATESSNKNHSATFPISLPTWFIKLFTKEEHVVLDPFLGSGTSSLAASILGRNSIGIEILDTNLQTAIGRFTNELPDSDKLFTRANDEFNEQEIVLTKNQLSLI